MGEHHAKYSPSKAEQWFGCPGGIAYAAQFEDKSSSDANYGTDGHTLAALFLTENKPAEDYRGVELPLGNVVDSEMIEAVQAYVDIVRDYAKGRPILVEQRVDYSAFAGIPDQTGTADAIIIDEDGEVIVIDLKMGKGVKVNAVENKQLQIYALGVLAKLEAEPAPAEAVEDLV